MAESDMTIHLHMNLLSRVLVHTCWLLTPLSVLPCVHKSALGVWFHWWFKTVRIRTGAVVHG